MSRSLGRYGVVSANLLYSHDTHNLLTRNINAPLPGTFDPTSPTSGTRPLGNSSNVYQFSSAANGNLEALVLKYRLQLTQRFYAFGVFEAQKNYTETDGITSFPSNQYDVRQDYGRAAIDHTGAYTGGFLWTLPYGIQVSPFLDVRTGLPFDITTGNDSNGDTIYNDRPAFANNVSRASAVPTPLGTFDVAPVAGQVLVPRNAGTAPGYIWLQLRAGKDLHLGPRPASSPVGPDGKPGPRPDRPWDLNFSVEVHNLTNHNNPGLPVGVISAQPCAATPASAVCSCAASVACSLAPSQFFGRSLSMAGDFSPITASNRTILLQTSFTF